MVPEAIEAEITEPATTESSEIPEVEAVPEVEEIVEVEAAPEVEAVSEIEAEVEETNEAAPEAEEADSEEVTAETVDEPATVEIDEPVKAELSGFAAIAAIEKEDALERAIDKVMSEGDLIGCYVRLNAFGNPALSSKRYQPSENVDYVFLDKFTENSADSIIVPYTRAQYLALPRKKKKSVLMTVMKLIDYNDTRRLLNLLTSRETQNPRILERIEKLKARLSEKERALPTAKLWEDSVKRTSR